MRFFAVFNLTLLFWLSLCFVLIAVWHSLLWNEQLLFASHNQPPVFYSLFMTSIHLPLSTTLRYIQEYCVVCILNSKFISPFKFDTWKSPVLSLSHIHFFPSFTTYNLLASFCLQMHLLAFHKRSILTDLICLKAMNALGCCLEENVFIISSNLSDNLVG